MRRFLAILACRLGRAVGRLCGRGSSLPGKLALKLCPDVLSRIHMPPQIVAVTGSNGKTSTVEMIAAILTAAGKRVVYNKEGSNQIEGVTTLVLGSATLSGKIRADVLLLESDERYAAHTFRFFRPTLFVVTNLCRDQLTRNGHPEWVFDALRPALAAPTPLLLNADDPLSSCFAADNPNVRWFGIDRCALSSDAPTGVYRDGAYCPLCHAPMVYDYAHYNQMGAYRCTGCGHQKPTPDFAVTDFDPAAGAITIDGSVHVELAFPSVYNIGNSLTAYAAARLCGVDSDTAAGVIRHYVLKNGRMVHFRLGAHPGLLLTSKHENSIAYDTNLRTIREAGTPCTVLVIVDAISRKYFTGETSWLWDIDFDLLNTPSVGKILLCGRYAEDLALRFSFTDIPPERIIAYESIPDAAAALAADGDEPVYVVTCFSDRDKLLSLTEREDG